MSTSASPGLDWADSPHHHGWLTTEAHRLLAFYQYAAADTEHGGFWWLGDDGRPLTHRGKQLWINARMIHTSPSAPCSAVQAVRLWWSWGCTTCSMDR